MEYKKLKEIIIKLKNTKISKKNSDIITELVNNLKKLKSKVKMIKVVGSLDFAINSLTGVVEGLETSASREFLQRQVNRSIRKLKNSLSLIKKSKEPKKLSIFSIPKGKKLSDLPLSYLMELSEEIGKAKVVKKLLSLSTEESGENKKWALNMISKFQGLSDWKSLLKDVYKKDDAEIPQRRRGGPTREDREAEEDKYLEHMKNIKLRFLQKNEIFGLIEQPVIISKGKITARGMFKLKTYGYKIDRVLQYKIIENCPIIGICIKYIKRKSVVGAIEEACNWINDERSSSDRLLPCSFPIKKGGHYYCMALDSDIVRGQDILINYWDFVTDDI